MPDTSSPEGKPFDVEIPDEPIVVTWPELGEGLPPGPPTRTSGWGTAPGGRSRPKRVVEVAPARLLSYARATAFGGPGVGSPATNASEVSFGVTGTPVSGLIRKFVSSLPTPRIRSATGLKSMAYCVVPWVPTGLRNAGPTEVAAAVVVSSV